MSKMTLILVVFLLFSFNCIFGQNWQTLPGQAKDIAMGGDGSIWVVGASKDDKDKDGPVFKFNEGDWKWEKFKGSGSRISVGPKGTPWIVNSNGRIFRMKGEGWQELPGEAKDIGVGVDGSVWVMGNSEGSKDGTCFKWDEKEWKWIKLTGAGVIIEVDPNGVAYIVNKKGGIFRKKGTTWQQLPGEAQDIGIGVDGSIYVVAPSEEGKSGSIYKWEEKDWKWNKITGSGIKITVSPDGVPYIINHELKMFFLK